MLSPSAYSSSSVPPKRLAEHPVLPDEELAVAPLFPHSFQLVVSHVLNLEDEDSSIIVHSPTNLLHQGSFCFQPWFLLCSSQGDLLVPLRLGHCESLRSFQLLFNSLVEVNQ